MGAGSTRRPGGLLGEVVGAVVVALVAGWLALAVASVTLTERLLFPAPPPSYADGGAVTLLRTADGRAVASILLEVEQPRGLVLYSHGNGEDLGMIRPVLEGFRSLGWSVLAYDYPGYGLSEGQPSVEGMLAAGRAAWEHATGTLGFEPRDIVLYGRSLGGGVAVDLAASHPQARGVVLESAFTSAFRVITRVRLLPWDVLDNERLLRRVSVPLLVIHGTRDEIIPFSHGPALVRAASGPTTFLWVDEAGHNDVADVAGPAFEEALARFLGAR